MMWPLGISCRIFKRTVPIRKISQETISKGQCKQTRGGDRFVINNFLSYDYRPQRSWGKVMLWQAYVILFTRGVCLSVCGDATPREADTPPPPEHTNPQSTHSSPPDQTPTPKSRYTLRTRHTHLNQTRPSPIADTPSGPDTPRSRHTPDQTPTPTRGVTHTPLTQNILRDTVNARAVRILLGRNLVSFYGFSYVSVNWLLDQPWLNGNHPRKCRYRPSCSNGFRRYTRFLGFLEFPGYHQWQQESQ